MELRDLDPQNDPKGGAKKSAHKTPFPIRRANAALSNKLITPLDKLPARPFPWRRLIVISLSGIVIGNALFTLVSYLLGHPQLTAWTGTVPQSTPSAVNDLIIGTINLMLALYILRKRP